jgi:hypothetical protein
LEDDVAVVLGKTTTEDARDVLPSANIFFFSLSLLFLFVFFFF